MSERSLPQFDLQLATALRDAGITRAAAGRAGVLSVARRILAITAQLRPSREVTADDAAAGLEHLGLSINALGPASGALFRGPDWRFTNRWQNSTRTTNHSRAIRVWSYVGADLFPR